MISADDYDYRENYKSKLKLFENFHSMEKEKIIINKINKLKKYYKI
jgi:hypothetical protein